MTHVLLKMVIYHALTFAPLLSNFTPVSPVNATETPGAVNNNNNSSTMMIEALQDPLLVPIYKGLPELPYATFILNLFCKFTLLSAGYMKLSHSEK